MSKPIDTQPPADAEVINEAFFLSYDDESITMRAWEVINAAIEVIDEGVKIRPHDDAYHGLISGYWALKAMFRRQLGVDVEDVSKGRWDAVREGLATGDSSVAALLADQPERRAIMGVEYYAGFDDVTLACMAYNGADVAQVAVLGADHQMSAADLRGCIIPMQNALTALRLLVLRLSGGSIESMADLVSRSCRPDGETLQ